MLSNKVEKSNTVGVTLGEITRSATSGVITPKLVRDMAILTGKSQPFIKSLLKRTAPIARKALINALVNLNK